MDKVCVTTSGNLANVIATEPVVRYVRQILYPNAYVVVRTPWPEVFAHLKNDWSKDTDIVFPEAFDETLEGFYNVWLAHLWLGIKANLVPPIDYASLSAFGGLLPYGPYRSTILKPADVDSGLQNHVLVHPGRSSKSKTFPAYWWNFIIGKLLHLQIPVAIIGQDSEDGSEGTVKIKTVGCLDLRNQLTLPQLFRVIRDAPILVTNDSAPLQIAGAFQNYAVLIATRKWPEYILPYRPSRLNIVFSSTVDLQDDCTKEDLTAALTDPHEVVRAILHRYPNRNWGRKEEPNGHDGTEDHSR